jgi:flagella basal body P-ring formation protein FlgA
MSRNKRAFLAHFRPFREGARAYIDSTMQTSRTCKLTGPMRSRLDRDIGCAPEQFLVAGLSSIAWAGLCTFAALVAPAPVHAQMATQGLMPTDVLQGQVEGVLKQQAMPKGTDADAANKPHPWRVEVELGQLDPRLKLAPCDKVKAYVPNGVQMWGKTRVGLRCEQGPVRWNVYWPVTIKVWGQALVAVNSLRAGSNINAEDLRMAEVDLAAQTSPAVTRAADVIGRAVYRNIEPGHSLRQDDVKARRWFAAGDPVRLTVRGEGFQASSDGTALTPGDEGHCARVRTDSGRIVCGEPVGDRRVELSL